MNISSISSQPSTPFSPSVDGSFKQRSQDFKALQTALQSGDLADAQTAFASFQKDLQSSSQNSAAGSAATPQTQMASDLQALSDALKSGDITSAQQSFATLQQDLQSVRGHHGHHHHHAAATDGDSDDSTQIAGVSGAPATPTDASSGSILNTLA